jgi:hypothetical protein
VHHDARRLLRRRRRYASVFWGLSQGWYAGQGASPTAEDVQAHFAEISEREGYIVPQSTTDEIVALSERFTK